MPDVCLSLNVGKNIVRAASIAQGNKFEVDAGSLGFAVTLFSILALCGIAVLMLRRSSASCGFAELGGPEGSKKLSALTLVGLWLVYISVASAQAYGIIRIDF